MHLPYPFSHLSCASDSFEEEVREAFTPQEVQSLLNISSSDLDNLITFSQVLSFSYNGKTYFPKWQFNNTSINPDISRILNLLYNVTTDNIEIIQLCLCVPDFTDSSIKAAIINNNIAQAEHISKMYNLL